MRIPAFVAIVVLGNLCGNLLLRAGMRASPDYVHAILNLPAISGVMLLIAAALAQLALLSWADLSYITPLTSIGYVLAAICGSVFLHEPLTAMRLTAILFIAAGAAAVSGTRPSTHESGSRVDP